MRRLLSFAIKAAVSALLLYVALDWVNVGTVKARLAQVDPGWAALGLLALFIQLVLSAVRWRQIVRYCDLAISFPRAFRYSLIGMFFNQTLPSSVGGDAVRVWLLGRQSDWRTALYSVLIDRVVGVVALAIIVVACLPWSFQLVANPVGRAALLLIGFGSIMAGAVFVGLSSRRLEFLRRWSVTRHLAAAATVATRMLRSPRTIVAIFGVSIVIQLLTAVAAWCAAKSVGAPFTLAYSLILVPPVILVAIVPISIAGWGVREGAMVMAFAYAGLAQSDGLIVSLLFGAGYFALGIIGGAIWILGSERPVHGAASIAGD